MKSVVYKLVLIQFLVFGLFGCEKKEEKSFVNPQLDQTGIDFNNKLSPDRDQNILDYLYFYNGGGVSIGDINNDGLPDIYFTGNQVENKLYLNKGNLQFEDITQKAGVAGKSTWNTGTTMADVNGDGLLDIYVSAVVGINGFIGHNELYINNGDLTFTESAREYGLDLENYSSQAAFFDVENDGDLDVYILNHAVHTNESFGPASIRNERVYESGDKLLLNENGKFIDVSEKAGIYGGANSYGLGLSTADFNNDGYTDIYVGNDFHEDDYYYINNGDGTFTESLKSKFGHVSRFSMGNDAADINNDGYVDLLTLDMLPEDETVLKASAGDDNVNLHNLKIDRFGYHPQYTRNMLQMNRGGEFFSETALMSGVAATDWSWGALFLDLDQDGMQDLFVSNGIPKRPNDLDYVKFTSNEQIQKKLDRTTLVDNEALEMMPSGAVTNYVFKGGGNAMFEDMSRIWIENDSIISTGLAYGDLDNDGDLDMVTNNINRPASIYENRNTEGDFLKLNLKYLEKNPFGIGAKAILYTSEGPQYRQLYTTKAYQSSSQPLIHFGIKKNTKMDSLAIIWPDQTIQVVHELKPNTSLSINAEKNLRKVKVEELFEKNTKTWFEKAENDLGLSYEHQENSFNNFDVQKLIPHQISDLGPVVKVVDIDRDGMDDVVFGASKFNPAQVFYRKNNGFEKVEIDAIRMDSLAEDTGILVEDFNNDNINDILLTSGGGEAIGRDKWLLDRLYLGNKDGSFEKDLKFPEIYANSSVVISGDYDNDGDNDLFIGSNSENYNYGAIPSSYLLKNENGKFTLSSHDFLKDLGMVNDAIWEDFDGDGDLDLIAVGEWMAPKFIENRGNSFVDISAEIIPKNLNGFWQKVLPFDIDDDGDTDYLLGNWGLNTKLKASEEFPLKMYYKDFDDNGLTETLLATEKNGDYYFLYGMDELSSQLSQMIRKRFTSYSEFSGKKIDEIFTKEELESAEVLKIHRLASGYLENTGGAYKFREFDRSLQLSPLKAMLKYDFNKDGRQEVLLAGNYFGVTPYHGRFDALGGNILINPGKILNSTEIGLNLTQKAVKDLSVLEVQNTHYLLVTINDAPAELYKINF